MKFFLMALLLFPALLFPQADSASIAPPVAYEGHVAATLTEQDHFDRMLRGFERSFGKHSGTRIIEQNAATDSLIAVSKINFVQKNLQSKEDVRGVITFDIVMKADATGVHYHIGNFYHKGNQQSRYASKNFELLTQTSYPPKVAGISFKNRKMIWQEMQDTVAVHIQARIAAFETQLQLDF